MKVQMSFKCNSACQGCNSGTTIGDLRLSLRLLSKLGLCDRTEGLPLLHTLRTCRHPAATPPTLSLLVWALWLFARSAEVLPGRATGRSHLQVITATHR